MKIQVKFVIEDSNAQQLAIDIAAASTANSEKVPGR